MAFSKEMMERPGKLDCLNSTIFPAFVNTRPDNLYNPAMKIVSFLPSGTEIACLLGLEKDLLAVTHECDFPASVRALPKVVHSRYDSKAIPQAEVHRLVQDSLARGESLYLIDEELLMSLKPDLILTQDLCQVCAPSGVEAASALKKLGSGTQILYLTPRTLDEIFGNILEAGRATGAQDRARTFIAHYKERIAALSSRLQGTRPKKVFFMEWIEPIFCSGHWIPEMVGLAGGYDPLEVRGKDSGPIPWDSILRENPEVIVIAPCGYHLQETAALAEETLAHLPRLEDLRAYQAEQIYAVDADSYFVRPGPRVVQGMEILAEIFHPEIFSGIAPANSFRKILKKSLISESV